MRILLISLFLIALSYSQDAITLNDGTIIYGRIIEKKAGSHVTILTSDEKRETFMWGSIKKLSQGNTAPRARTSQATRTKLSPNKIVIEADKSDSESIREAWLKRGGMMTGSVFALNLTAMSQETENLSLEGSGFGLRAGSETYFLTLPNPESQVSSWSGAKFGFLVDFNHFNISGSSEASSEFTFESNQSSFTTTFNLGYTFGLGTFALDTEWTGAVISLNYSPSYVMTIPEEGDTKESFNGSGFSFDIDFTTLTASTKDMAPESHFRISVFMLPQTDETPFIFTLGLSSVFY